MAHCFPPDPVGSKMSTPLTQDPCFSGESHLRFPVVWGPEEGCWVGSGYRDEWRVGVGPISGGLPERVSSEGSVLVGVEGRPPGS